MMNKVMQRGNAVRCEFCDKAFVSSEFLEGHKQRRHQKHDETPQIIESLKVLMMDQM